MKIRRVALAFSSVLFTIALLIPAQEAENRAEETYQSRFRDISIDTESPIPQDQIVMPNAYAPIGMAELAVIAVGLLVTWAGYFRGARWAWFAMLVIVWLWAFPVLVAPYVIPWQGFGAHLAWIPDAIREVAHNTIGSFLARAYLETVTMFVLMLVALVLPAKEFLRRRL